MKQKILIVDDERTLRESLAKWFNRTYECLTAADGAEAIELIRANSDLALVISDVRMPGMDGVELAEKARALNATLGILILTAYGSVDLAVEAMKRGANDFIQKPITDLPEFERRVGDLIHRLTLEKEVSTSDDAQAVEGIDGFIGRSPAMEKLYRLIRKVAPTPATVLVQGPSGTGKELVARALHDLSPRAKAPFLAVECSALASNLLESELFGYAPGTFTGGLKEGKAGCFEAVRGGTLFLDEIGEISPDIQVKLLRVLESRTIQRVGSTETTPVDFRLVAATNKNLASLIAEGKFREDLYYRLNVIDLHLAPLKERPGDVALLAQRFVQDFSRAYGGTVKGIASDALQALEAYGWPGNVRQLRNVIEKMVVLSSGGMLTREDVPEEIRAQAAQPPVEQPVEQVAEQPVPTTGEKLRDIEKQRVIDTLASCKGNRTRAAEMLGISRRTLHRKIRDWGLT